MNQEITQTISEISAIKNDIAKITHELSLLRKELSQSAADHISHQKTLSPRPANSTQPATTPGLANTSGSTLKEITHLKKEVENFKKNSCFPAGHYYSPIISIEDIKAREKEIWGKNKEDHINGINLRTNDQKRLLQSLTEYYPDLPFQPTKQPGLRYYFDNNFYSYTDGVILYAMIRHLKPKRIIEIGSGFSSAVMLDTNQLFFENRIKLTFIEPNPERLYEQINDKDKQQTTIHRNLVQSVPLDIFKELEKGDILFVDSSHIVKTGSDVHYILFEILPLLNSGVFVHFHDIFFPFEYPKPWVYEGRNWNEAYFLKSFLMYNEQFRMSIFSHYLHTHHKDSFRGMPLCYKNHGGNLWIERQ